jgi:hypothetical protein
MLLLTMSKAIAGLGLPPRPVWPPATPVFGTEREPAPIAIGETIQGTIEPGDLRLQNGALADEFRIELESGQKVTIEAKGGRSFTEPCCSLDTVLRVSKDDRTIVEDDDSGGGFDPRLELIASERGHYVVRLNTYGSGERRGPYSLRAYGTGSP